jgi:hypothetical protein
MLVTSEWRIDATKVLIKGDLPELSALAAYSLAELATALLKH